jgi:hypothetical protein
MISMYEECGS